MNLLFQRQLYGHYAIGTKHLDRVWYDLSTRAIVLWACLIVASIIVFGLVVVIYEAWQEKKALNLADRHSKAEELKEAQGKATDLDKAMDKIDLRRTQYKATQQPTKGAFGKSKYE